MILEIKDLNTYIEGGLILNALNLNVEDDEIVAVLGPNGAGKTTLLRTISGLLPYEGSIKFKDKELSELSPREIVEHGIAHCPQGARPFPEMTVQRNLEVGGYLKDDKTNEENLKLVKNLFPILEERKNQIANTLSGGERQMLSIARTLMADPKLMLLDEPSVGLAPKIIETMIEKIKKIRERTELPILLVEQNTEVAFSLADRIYMLVNGTIEKKGKVEDLAEEVIETYF